MNFTTLLAKRTAKIALVLGTTLVVSACAVDPQSSEVSRLIKSGYAPVPSASSQDTARALSYSGDVRQFLRCKLDGNSVRIQDFDASNTVLETMNVRHDTSLDSYVIVQADGAKESIHILTIVREILDGKAVLAREIETARSENGGALRLENGTVCQVI